jgi:alpha,alpha-trehalase
VIPIPQPPAPEPPPEPIPPPSPPPEPTPEPPPTDPIPPPIRAHRCGAVVAICLALTLSGAVTSGAAQTPLPRAARVAAVRNYIKQTWRSLTRSARDLPKAAPDPKFHREAGAPSPVYLAADESRTDTEQKLRAVLSAEDLQRIELRTLPARADQVRDHGLLYVPYPYVVPGGRFNEMYGWDSYFIQLGLLRDGELELARNMTDNFLYEIAHYGMILNANRTYFLTRSQPPFLTEMILGVYERTHDRAWLRATLAAIDRYYTFWTTPPHLIASIGLSRYYDLGDGPAPEVLADERDAQGRTHYDRVREYYRTHTIVDYDVTQFYDRAGDRLTDRFYKGDRSMRESGFDPSNRFGPFSAAIVDYAPVCLNALLYRMEQDAARIHTVLGETSAAAEWSTRALRRRQLVDRYLWDPAAGLYFDYNFETGRRRSYPFATTFYPMWAGLSSPRQARQIVGNLARFEAPGGILTSTQTSGSQWDAPFGWAPLQLMAVGGLRRYGYDSQADRIARKFVSLVVEDFDAHGAIVEKYDVQRRSSDLAAGLRFGYTSNEIGFGWTNAAVLELLAGLERQRAVASAAERPAVTGWKELSVRPQDHDDQRRARRTRRTKAVFPLRVLRFLR